MNGRVLLFYRTPQDADRWFRGDHRWRAPVRRLLRGPDPVGGIDRVFLNLCAGLDRLGVDYQANIAFSEIRPEDKVGVIGCGRASLEGYGADNPIVAGVAVSQHPDEWPDLFETHPVSRYVVHSEWIAAIYRRVYGDRISRWAVGIDTDHWRPAQRNTKQVDFLIYDKIRWSHERISSAMVAPICQVLERHGLKYERIRYGHYKPADLSSALDRCRAVIFLCEHETQGLACQQAMSAGLPVIAWDPGQWLDPWRFRYARSVWVPATSVPFFDEHCGLTFEDFGGFEAALTEFLDRSASGEFAPRQYVLDNLSLEKCARDYLEILNAYA